MAFLLRKPLLLLALSFTLSACYPAKKSTTNLYLEGQLQAERGNLTSALDSLSKAIDRNPDMSLAYVARGQIYKEQGDYNKAAGDFEKASTLEPFNFNAHYQLGLMYQYLQRFADAITAYQRAVEIRPLDPEANMNLAMAYTEVGQPMRGLPYAQRAVENTSADVKSANSYANLGTLYAQLGFDDAAIASLKKALELNSRQPEVYLNLGQEYLKVSQFQQARNVYETAQGIAPSPAISERLGLACYKLNDFPKATAAFNDALRQQADYVPALNGLGVVAMTQSIASTPPDIDAEREALAYWDRSLKINPNQPPIRQLVEKYGNASAAAITPATTPK
jgi:tetratricopeptide (TPR) repeat protein